MEIVTERLVLREFTGDDLPAFSTYRRDPRYAEFYGPDEVDPRTSERLLHTFRSWAREEPRRDYQLAIAERDPPGALVGCCGLRQRSLAAGCAEFGIELAPRCWGRGYATEAGGALLDHGFDRLGVREARAVSVAANTRIERLLRRLGFAAVGTRAGPEWMADRGWSQTEWRLVRAARS